jgi:esterase
VVLASPGSPPEQASKGEFMTQAIDGAEWQSHLRDVLRINGLAEEVMRTPRPCQIIVGSIRLHYLDWGDPSAPIMLFLHGGGQTAHTWDALCHTLSVDYRCLALDQRGHGDSEWSPVMAYSRADHVADLEEFLTAVGADDKFLLVGMSMGGLNSLTYASRHSEDLAGLVVVDVGPRLRSAGTARIRDFMVDREGFATIEEAVEYAIGFNHRRDRALLRRSLLQNLRQTADGGWTWKYDRRHLGRLGAAPDDRPRVDSELVSDLSRISCPVLVVRGGESDVFWDEDALEVATSVQNGRWVKVEGAGHTVQGDNPTALIKEINTFTREIGYVS